MRTWYLFHRKRCFWLTTWLKIWLDIIWACAANVTLHFIGFWIRLLWRREQLIRRWQVSSFQLMTCCCCCCLLLSPEWARQYDPPLWDVQNVLWCSSQALHGNLAGSCILSAFHALELGKPATKPNQTFLWVSSGPTSTSCWKIKSHNHGWVCWSKQALLFQVFKVVFQGHRRARPNYFLKFLMENPSSKTFFK